MKPISKSFLKLGLTTLIVPLISLINHPHASASTLYGIDYAGPAQPSTLYRIDETTGTTTLVGAIGFNQCGGMAFNSVGQLFAACNRADTTNAPVLITVNPLTGVGTEVGATGTPGDISDISFRPSDDQLFAYSVTGPQTLYTINTLTGQATLIGATGLSSGGNGIAFAADNTLFLSNTQSLYTLDQTTGTATAIASMSFGFVPPIPGARANSLAFQPISDNLYATVRVGGGSNAQTYLGILNTTTGFTTIVGPTLNRLDSLAWSPNIQAVPESNPLSLFGLSFLVLLSYCTRENKTED